MTLNTNTETKDFLFKKLSFLPFLNFDRLMQAARILEF